MGKRSDFCIHGTTQSRGQSSVRHYKVTTAIRLIADGVSASRAAKDVGMDYKLLMRLIDARQEK